MLAAVLPLLLQLSGTVFLDRNGNGVRDAGEPGKAGVAVSNQREVVQTTSDGSYRLSGNGTGVVSVTVPDGFRTSRNWWRRADGGNLDFGLVEAPPPAEFVFIHASDTHISPQSIGRIRRLRAVVDSIKPAFVLITGDLVRDALRVGEAEAAGYYELFQQEVGAFSAPVWTVPGNHEIFGIERHLSLVSPNHPLYGRGMYRSYRGPDYYSFTFGGVHFVGLNTVDIDDLWYYGHVDSTQVAWLQADLATVPAAVPVVTFDHIPFFAAKETVDGYRDTPPAPTVITVGGRALFRHTVSNAGDVIAALQGHPWPLALGGHLHTAERLSYPGIPTRFHLAAAVIGPSDGAGLSFPSGVTVYRVRNGRIDDGTFVPLP
jgi:predicted MPP superfamily phosphohydrolase